MDMTHIDHGGTGDDGGDDVSDGARNSTIPMDGENEGKQQSR